MRLVRSGVETRIRLGQPYVSFSHLRTSHALTVAMCHFQTSERVQQLQLTLVDVAQCIPEQSSIAQSSIGTDPAIRRHIVEGVA
jgi:hypothetical protein